MLDYWILKKLHYTCIVTLVPTCTYFWYVRFRRKSYFIHPLISLCFFIMLICFFIFWSTPSVTFYKTIFDTREYFSAVVLFLLCLQLCRTEFFVLTWVILVGRWDTELGAPLAEQNWNSPILLCMLILKTWPEFLFLPISFHGYYFANML